MLVSPVCSSSFFRRFSSSLTAVSLAYKRTGEPNDKVPLLIGHGLFGQKQNWTSVSKALNRRLRAPIYTFDWRNHGESPWTDEHTYELMAADLANFIRETVRAETGHEKIDLLGHSMGGKAAAYFALQPTTQRFLNKLIIEDVAPHRGSSRKLFLGYVEALQQLDLTKPRREILTDLEAVVPDLSVRQFLLTNLIADSANRNHFKWKINLKGVGRSLDHVLNFRVESGSFSGPCLYVYGQKSDFVRNSDLTEIRNFFPNAQIEGIANAGHWLHAEQPSEFVDICVKFLSEN
ncbi:AB hydrolase-1 domain-containing protein [Aphelenchoides besseyi]|nr:AB hydrolase-1 domain-containing protein [Aphelenchoides besseyi]